MFVTKASIVLNYLLNYEIIHTEECQLTCYVCVKVFIDLNYLLKHERTHTGECPFKFKFKFKKGYK